MQIKLALGGGGVKGFSHVGVLRYLESAGFEIRAVAGSSIGGLVGSVYAAGYSPDEMEDSLSKLDQSKFYTRVPGDGPSLMGLGGVTQALKDVLGDRTFSQLSMPLAVTAVDVETGRLVTLDRGPVLDAVLATIAIPGVFPPKDWEGMRLVDGGLLSPVPVGLARQIGPRLPVVAVVLSPPLSDWTGDFNVPDIFNRLQLFNRLYQTRWLQSFDILRRSIDIAGCYLSDLLLEMEPPDVIIRPEVGEFGVINKVNIHQVVQAGEQAAAQVFDELQEVVGWKYRLAYRFPWLIDFVK